MNRLVPSMDLVIELLRKNDDRGDAFITWREVSSPEMVNDGGETKRRIIMVAHKRTFCERLVCLCRNYFLHQTSVTELQLNRLRSLRNHCSDNTHQMELVRIDTDSSQQAADHASALHARQAEHQARQFWQTAYPDEHPNELISGAKVAEPIYAAKERQNAVRYCLEAPAHNPLHE